MAQGPHLIFVGARTFLKLGATTTAGTIPEQPGEENSPDDENDGAKSGPEVQKILKTIRLITENSR
jgi:hypothetical protein